jgi:AcrR family transcriptional regulator
VSRQDWLDAGLKALAAEGPEAVRIERLAKTLGVARSGYYWHFENRQDYVEALLQHWAHESTEVVVANRELREMEPRERLLRTAEMVDRHDLGRHDLPLRVWAIREPLVARAIRKVTRRRLDHMRRALDELGFEGDDLEMRAHLLVGYLQSERTVFADLSAARRARLRPMQLDLLLTAPRKSQAPKG